ncbi:MAG: hypothetical protein NW215_00565 [Hyphomicrobiales bacterium]|nr:hypothetical protein [Hyphomicrobiales bacterium]
MQFNVILVIMLILATSSSAAIAKTYSKVFVDSGGFEYAKSVLLRNLTLQNSIALESTGAQNAASQYCNDPSKELLILVTRQLELARLMGCVGSSISEKKIDVPGKGTLYLYSDPKSITGNKVLSEFLVLISERENNVELAAWDDHKCESKDPMRQGQLPPLGLKPAIKPWAAPERVEEAGMTVEPVVFVHKSYDGHPCFLRVVEIDSDSPFAVSLKPGHIFIGAPEAYPDPDYVPAVNSPQNLRDRMRWAENKDSNYIALVYVFESDTQSDNPADYLLISSRTLLDGSIDVTEKIEFVPGCKVHEKSKC